MESTTRKSLGTAFHSLPQPIKDWLSSLEIIYQIDNILAQFNIEYEKDIVIPNLVLRLCVQDLDPRDFINELSSRLNVDFVKAKEISQIIEQNIFRPIEIELRRDVGVEIQNIAFGKPGVQAPRPINAPIPSRIQETQAKPISIKPMEIPSGPNVSSWLKPKDQPTITTPPSEKSQTIPTPPTQQKPSIPNSGPKIDLEHFEIKGEPFILHQEPGTAPATEAPRVSPGFSFKTSNSSLTAEKPAPQKSISVKLETPRSVNYSDFRTPLPPTSPSPNANRKNTVDLRNNNNK